MPGAGAPAAKFQLPEIVSYVADLFNAKVVDIRESSRIKGEGTLCHTK
jgi:hypothetical protein